MRNVCLQDDWLIRIRFQAFTVGFDHAAVPLVALFFVAFQRTGAVAVQVHIDHTIALFDLRRGAGDQVNAAPAGIAHHVHAVVQRFADLHQVVVHVADAVIILHRKAAVAVRHQGVVGTQAVFGNEQGLVVAAVQPVQGVAQALGVDLPAPLADLGIRIALEGGDHVAGSPSEWSAAAQLLE